jgi:hypothetical protein
MHWRARDIKLVAAWLLGAGVLVASAVWVIRTEEQKQLESSAEQSALQWAQFAERTLPPVEDFRPGTVLTPKARQQLLTLTRFKNIFEYKIFDSAGDQIFTSTDLQLDESAPLPVRRAGMDGNGSASGAAVRDAVLAGKTVVALQREPVAGRPAVYSEAYMPVVKGGKVQGVLEVYVDQTDLAASTRAGFARVTTSLGGGYTQPGAPAPSSRSWRMLTP